MDPIGEVMGAAHQFAHVAKRVAKGIAESEHRHNMNMKAELTHATGRRAEKLARERTRGMKH